MSSASSVNDVLTGFLAGRVSAERVVTVVAASYYGERGAGSREQLRHLMEIIERAHPGIVELSANGEKPGFGVRLAERPFPKRYEPELRQIVEGLVTAPSPPLHAPGLFTRIVSAIRKVFSA